MKKLYFLTLILLISFVGLSQTQNDWEKKEAFAGQKRDRAVGFAVGDYGYIATGEDTVSMTHNDLWRYDPATDTWAQMMSLPAPTRRNATGLTIGTKGYVGLGVDSSTASIGYIHSDWWEYDPVANNWTQKANYPGGIDINGSSGWEGVYYAASFAIDNKGYVCGGKMGADFYGTDLWEYDPIADQWTRMADFPGGDRYQMSGLAINGKGYVGLGIDHDLYRKDWWEYDPVLNTWTQKSNLPGVERGSASSFVLGERGFIVFGSDGGYKDELWQYNPYTDSWNIRANFPGGARKNAVAFAIGDSAYAGTGKGSTGLRRNFYRYYPLLPVGIEEEEHFESNIYPNPIDETGYLTVNDMDRPEYFLIVDLQGRILRQEMITAYQQSFERAELSSGQYVMVIIDDQDNIISKQKIIFR